LLISSPPRLPNYPAREHANVLRGKRPRRAAGFLCDIGLTGNERALTNLLPCRDSYALLSCGINGTICGELLYPHERVGNFCRTGAFSQIGDQRRPVLAPQSARRVNGEDKYGD
jgi:hypothetical protein